MGILKSISNILRCPDDGGSLSLHADRMECSDCLREFAREGDFISLVSKEPASFDGLSAYHRSYLAARREDAAATPGWSISGSNLRPALEYKQRQVVRVGGLLSEGGSRRDVLCDFSAGPGYYTLQYARTWETVIHCDLSLDSLRHAQNHARKEGLNNIAFVHMDYLRPPFRGTLPSIVCMDTLIRGPEHERALLQAILESLEPRGVAVVDFHNWWHNPLRRLGLLPDNFVNNRSYSRRELDRMLSKAGISGCECFPFRQEEPLTRSLLSLVAQGLPPTRWLYRFRHATKTNTRIA